MGGEKSRNEKPFNGAADKDSNKAALEQAEALIKEKQTSDEKQESSDEKTPTIDVQEVANLFFNEEVKGGYQGSDKIFDKKKGLFMDRLADELEEKWLQKGNEKQQIWGVIKKMIKEGGKNGISKKLGELLEDWYQKNQGSIVVPIRYGGQKNDTGKTGNSAEKEKGKNPTVKIEDEDKTSNQEKEWPSYTKFKKKYSVQEESFRDQKGKSKKEIISPMFIEKKFGGKEMRIIGYNSRTGVVTLELFDFYSKKGDDVVFHNPPKRAVEKMDFKEFKERVKNFELDRDDDLKDRWEDFNKEAVKLDALKKAGKIKKGTEGGDSSENKKDFNNKSNKKMEKIPQNNTNNQGEISDEDLELRKQEIYQEGDDYTEEHVGEGEFEYRITPTEDAGGSKKTEKADDSGAKEKQDQRRKEEIDEFEASGEEEAAILGERDAIKKGREEREKYLKKEAQKRKEIDGFEASGEEEEAILNEREAKKKAKIKRDEYLKEEGKKKKEEGKVVELGDLEKESSGDENERKFQNPDEQGNVGINSDKAAHDAWAETEDSKEKKFKNPDELGNVGINSDKTTHDAWAGTEDDEGSSQESPEEKSSDEEVVKIRTEEIGGLDEARTEGMSDYLDKPDLRAEIKKAKAEEGDYEEITRLDELKFQMERDYNQLIKEQKHEATEWSKLSFFEKIKNKIGIGKKEGSEDKSNPEQIDWEYSTVKERVQRFKEKFGNSYEEYIRELMKNEKEENQETKEFIFCEQAIKGKQEDGTEIAKTIFEDFNGKLKELDSVRVEAMKEYNNKQEKGKIKESFQDFYFKSLEKYAKMSTPKKALLGAVIVGGASGLFGAGIAAGTTVGCYRFVKSLGISVAHSSIINPLMGIVSKKFRDKDFQKVESSIAEGFEKEKSGNFLKQLEDFNKREKRRGAARVAATGLTVGALSYGTMKGVGYLNDTPPEIPKEESALEGERAEKKSGKVYTSIDVNDDLGESGWEAENPGAEKGVNIGDKVAPLSSEPPEGAYSGVDEEGLVFEDESESDFEEVPDDADFSLKEGDNVWDKLVSHFNGDEGKTAETINEFRKETAKELISKHGMETREAQDFIKWRFRHMDVGAEFALNNEGKLEIDNFINSDKLNQYEHSNYKK